MSLAERLKAQEEYWAVMRKYADGDASVASQVTAWLLKGDKDFLKVYYHFFPCK